MPARKISTTSAADDTAYLKFLATVRLVGLGLKSSSTVLERELFWDLVKDDSKAQSVTESYRPTEIGKDYFEAEGRYEVKIARGEQTALEIECIFEVHMHAAPPFESTMAERFTKTDLRFILLPYARHFVTDATGQMQIPPIVLPLATVAGKARVGKGTKKSASSEKPEASASQESSGSR